MTTEDRSSQLHERTPVIMSDVLSGGAVARFLIAALLTLLLITLLYLGGLAVHVHINIWWFQSLGLGGVYGRIWSTQEFLFLLYGSLTLVYLSAIFFISRALTNRPGPSEQARQIDRLLTTTVAILSVIISVTAGHAMASEWQLYLLAHHAQSFGITDPIHHRDVGFYVFSMPWRETLAAFAATMLFLGALEIAGLATLYTLASPFQTERSDVRRIVAVGSLFAAALFGYLAWRNFFLNPYNLDRPGTAFGGGATFVHAALWWYPIVGTVQALAAVVLLVNTVLRRIGLTALALVPIAVSIVAGSGQGIFQRFVVAPNELSAEYNYLGYTIDYTRRAYGMDGWKAREYTPHALTSGDVSRDSATIGDARIADLGAFTQVMRQRQENRTYYTFNEADIDRYLLPGSLRQVLLAAREMAFWQLPNQAQTWVNEHIKFTHGYGLTMAPANTVTPDGQPVLWVQNIPVQETQSGLPPVVEPRVYFGEYTNSWVLVNATTPEFDSSQADQDTSYRYSGPDGVPVGSGLKRLSLAWALEGGIPFFDKLNISGYVRPATRILLHRTITDRVETIAPWLTLDSDPYLVLRKNGSLVWMLDGMTSSDHYPYSEPTWGDNYRRNSVKIVVDAYTGRTTFYAFDPSDPILRAWSAIFPGLMHPLSTMPADLRAHIKYPDSYLTWQALAFRRYHVTDITSYYNGDNQWDIESSSSYNWNDQATETGALPPVWTTARLFGEKSDSFFSILPFSVRGKATMAGYLAADNNSYHVTALDMPRGAQTMGATQFESLYQQAPTISSTLTLLDQSGSQVVPGQLLILPVGKALLYIKPLYLRSTGEHSLPQLIRVVVGTQNAVNWGYTLQDALHNLETQGDISAIPSTVSGQPSTTPSPTPGPVTPPSAGKYDKLSDARLIALADQYYADAESTPSLTQKDRDLKQVGIILRVLQSRHPSK
jgi:uncharacterized membrane protein (UPF0182 family)